jgi:hypothetical protein
MAGSAITSGDPEYQKHQPSHSSLAVHSIVSMEMFREDQFRQRSIFWIDVRCKYLDQASIRVAASPSFVRTTGLGESR